MIYIYALIDPFTFRVRYIGKSIRPKERLANHCNEKSKCYRSNWIRSLIKKGKKPILVILQILPGSEDWRAAEMRWIAVIRKYRKDLVNCTDGGDGVSNISGEGKARMLKTWKGRKHKAETKIKIGNASRGRKNPASSPKISQKMARRPITWKDKLQLANRKFDDSLLPEVIKDLQNGMLVKDAAIKYNVHRTTISKIKAGNYLTFKQKTYNYIKPRLYHGTAHIRT